MLFFACFSTELLVLGASIVLSIFVISSIIFTIFVGFSMILLVSGRSMISFRLQSGPVIPTLLITLVFALAINGTRASDFKSEKIIELLIVGDDVVAVDEMLRFLNESARIRLQSGDASVEKNVRH